MFKPHIIFKVKKFIFRNFYKVKSIKIFSKTDSFKMYKKNHCFYFIKVHFSYIYALRKYYKILTKHK